MVAPSSSTRAGRGTINLGVSYVKGQGVPQDYAESVRWYRLAAA